jgi:hypothetical protein
VQRLTELCLFIDQGHRRSDSAAQLRRFVAWWRRESDGRKPDTATVKASPAVEEQKCVPVAPQSSIESSASVSERVAGPATREHDHIVLGAAP